MKTAKIFSYIFFLIVSITSLRCTKEQIPLIPPENFHSSGYLILNEGLYGQNNSSITFYDLESGNVEQNVYAAMNNGDDLGDTANDFALCCGKVFIVVDKSKKIEVISIQDFHSEGFIDFTDYGSPREIIIPDSTHGYVSTLNDLIVEFNPSSMNITGTVNVGSKPEGLTLNGENLFVANSGFGIGNTVSVIDTSAHAVISTISVWQNPNTFLSFGDNVYLVSIGKYDAIGLGAVTKINAQNLVPTDTILIAENPGKAVIAENNLLVVNGSGLLKINLDTFSIDDSLFIKGSNVNPITGVIYSVSFDKTNKKILLTNPKDFLQNGEVILFDLYGEKLKTISAGLNPGRIQFITKN